MSPEVNITWPATISHQASAARGLLNRIPTAMATPEPPLTVQYTTACHASDAPRNGSA
jgi:hypothetical protein